MHYKSANIAVYTVEDFSTSNHSFFFFPLQNILEKFPFLEHPHKQSFVMLLFAENATGNATVDNSVITLEEGKVICIKPNSVFSLQINKYAKGHVVCFAESFYSLRYNINILYNFSFWRQEHYLYIRLNEKQKCKWIRIIHCMEEELTTNQKGVEDVMRSYINIILFEFDRALNKLHQSEPLSFKKQKLFLFDKMLEDNFKNQKSPSFYANKLHITTNYLNKLCRIYRNTTSSDIIKSRVNIEAKRLLNYTDLSISEIACQLGFENTSYFITYFKKNNGVTPENFRKAKHKSV